MLFALGAVMAGGSRAAAENTAPQILEQPAAVYPSELKRQKIVGSADLVFRITEDGRVDQVVIDYDTHDEFGEAAAAAVRKFKYKPAQKDGRPVAISVQQTFEFSLDEGELAALEAARVKESLPPGPPVVSIDEATEWPKLKKEVRPAVPVIPESRWQIAQAVVGFVVDEQGQARDVHLVVTSHAECVEPALAAVRQWRFTPGRKAGQAVRVALEVPIVFFPGNPGSSGLRVRPGVRNYLPPETEVEKLAPGSGMTPPKPVKLVPPEFPEEMAARHRRGGVVVEFIINEQGAVSHVRSMGESNQFFAAMTERAVSQWQFKPATKNGKPVACRAKQEVQFRPY